MTPPIDKAALESETAAAIFNRINRRRAETVQPVAGSGLGAPGASLSDPSPAVDAGRGLFETPPVAPRAVADRFPRSATMRLVLKHPAVALGLGLPAAGLLLKSPASRRLLGLALRVGAGEELQNLIRLTNAAVQPTAEDPSEASLIRPKR